jgi:hypothetical protein
MKIFVHVCIIYVLFFYSLFVPVSLYSQQVRNPLFLTGVYLNDDHFRDVTIARHKCFFLSLVGTEVNPRKKYANEQFENKVSPGATPNLKQAMLKWLAKEMALVQPKQIDMRGPHCENQPPKH